MEYELSQDDLKLLEDGETLHIGHHAVGQSPPLECNRDICRLSNASIERLKDGEEVRWKAKTRNLILTLGSPSDEIFVWSKDDLREKYGDWYSPQSDGVYVQSLARVLRTEDLNDKSARIILSTMERLWGEDEMYVTGIKDDPNTTFIDWQNPHE